MMDSCISILRSKSTDLLTAYIICYTAAGKAVILELIKRVLLCITVKVLANVAVVDRTANNIICRICLYSRD
jgi:hypothetical protein